jgi:protein translocase SecG subunit
MLAFISILIILISIVLIAFVLLQPGKGDLSASFGGIGGQMGTMFGMQRTVTMLAKLTKILAIAILFLVLIANKFFVGQETASVQKLSTEGAEAPLNMPMSTPVDVPKQ